MARERFQRVKRVFQGALALPPERRSAYLDEASDGDRGLRSEVLALLEADDEGADFLARLLPEKPDGDRFGESLVGARIGHYVLHRVISTGGMGTVFEAVQEHPRRSVAVKVLRSAIASRSGRHRFEYEAEVLANLHHPGIAQVYEAGTWDGDGRPGAASSGVPYFVMEYIPDARSLTEYAAEERLAAKERLRLFLQVLEAVHHGHQKGIIHRDLKPANILVDAEGHVKIIDFGVARATGLDLQITTQETRAGQLIGTVQYMSPEQCRAEPGHLDIRSDVYALGVVLFELLCGRPPHDVSGATLLEAARRIIEEPIERPSSVSKSVRGDVETILLKALEKEPERRYASAHEMGSDVAAFLEGAPITARPPSAIYQLTTLARRNKALFVGLAVASLVLLAGVVVSAGFFIEARAAARTSERVNRFYTRMLASLDPVQLYWMNDQETATSSILVGEEPTELATRMLLDSLPEIGRIFAESPELEADVRETVGMTLCGLGRYSDAEAQLRDTWSLRSASLGTEEWRTLRSQAQLARILAYLGRYRESADVARDAHDLMRKTLGEGHSYTQACATIMASSLSYLGEFDEVNALYAEALRFFERRPERHRRRIIVFRVEWSRSLLMEGRPVEAEEHARRALESSRGLDRKDMTRMAAEWMTAIIHLNRGDHEQVRRILESLLAVGPSVLGESHHLVFSWKTWLTQVLETEPATFERRRSLLIQSLEGQRVHVGEGNLNTRKAWRFLIELLTAFGRYDELAGLLRERAESRLRELGPEHEYTSVALREWADFLWGIDEREDACGVYGEWLDSMRARFGERGRPVLDAVNLHARRLRAAGRTDDSRRLQVEVLERGRRAAESWDADPSDLDDHAYFLLTAEDEDLRDPARALELASRAADRTDRGSADHLETLALAYRSMDRLADAVAAQERAVGVTGKSGGPTGYRELGRVDVIAPRQRRLVRLYLQSGEREAAERALSDAESHYPDYPYLNLETFVVPAIPLLLEENEPEWALERALRCVELRSRILDSGHWKRAEAESFVGAALSALGRHAEAEDRLLSAYEELSRHPIAFEARARVRRWLVRHYEDRGLVEAAERWRGD